MEIEKIFSGAFTGTKGFTQHNVRTANATGFGAATDDYAERGIDLNEQIIRNKPATFFMRVGCNSMQGAGIVEGDVVVVDRSVKATNGKIVIAVIDGEMLIRRYERTFNKLYLVPETPKLSRIEVGEYSDFSVWGVVVWVLRQLER